MKPMTPARWVGLTVFVFLAFAAPAAAQSEPSQAQRILDEPFRMAMDQSVPLEKRAVFSYGGWYRSSFWDVDDNIDTDGDGRDDGRHILRRQQLRLWGQANIDQVHQFYVRGRFDYLDWNHNTSYDGNDSDWEGPYLDRAWYDFNLNRARKAYGLSDGDFDYTLRVGRQYVVFGTGLTLSLPLDAIWMRGDYSDFQLTGLLAKSAPHTYNIDETVVGNNYESRRFWGVQLNYTGWKDHEPFAYYFSQEDQDAGIERTVTVGNDSYSQTFGYDSRYVGVGSQGQFFHPQLQYTVETAAEFGKSFADSSETGDSDNRQNIEAWIIDTELRHLLLDPGQSQISVEYLLASGDPDRESTPTGTVGGNRAHTTDLSFSAWGFRNTGLSLAPVMSNLGMARVGASTFPAPKCKALEQMTVGTDFFVYHKQQSDGAMSDVMSTDHSGFVGTAVDVYVNWRILSDLAWTARYGVFMPGDAMTDNSDRQQFFTGVTLNF